MRGLVLPDDLTPFDFLELVQNLYVAFNQVGVASLQRRGPGCALQPYLKVP